MDLVKELSCLPSIKGGGGQFECSKLVSPGILTLVDSHNHADKESRLQSPSESSYTAGNTKKVVPASHWQKVQKGKWVDALWKGEVIRGYVTSTEIDQTSTEIDQTSTEIDQTSTEIDQTSTEIDQTSTEIDADTSMTSLDLGSAIGFNFPQLNGLIHNDPQQQHIQTETFKAVQLLAKHQQQLQKNQEAIMAALQGLMERTMEQEPSPCDINTAADKVRVELSNQMQTEIKLRSKNPGHFAAQCAKLMFSGPELVSRNVRGKRCPALDAAKITKIKAYVERNYGREPDKVKTWVLCRKRIDAWGRHLKGKGVPREEDWASQ
ncbi:hypothetical protein Bbelb_109020 [Branchiostoma belcheri]|nr:hypothetical protein Bbelb_109020 [Branchiostoma belcheri]